jgi:Aminotransferase class-V
MPFAVPCVPASYKLTGTALVLCTSLQHASTNMPLVFRADSSVHVLRRQVADLIGADPKEIVFTSGATESNNMALKGVANFYKERKNHIITTQTDHKCVLDSARHLQQRGFEVGLLFCPTLQHWRQPRPLWLPSKSARPANRTGLADFDVSNGEKLQRCHATPIGTGVAMTLRAFAGDLPAGEVRRPCRPGFVAGCHSA